MIGIVSILRDTERFPARGTTKGKPPAARTAPPAAKAARHLRRGLFPVRRGDEMTASFDAVAELTKTFSLLFQKKNWMLAVPLLIGTLVAVAVVGLTFVLALGPAIATAIYGGASGNMSSPTAFLPALLGVGGLLVLVGVLVAFAIAMFTYGWAYAA